MPEGSRLEHGWLEGWLQPRHLDPSRIESYRAAFDAHPAHILVLPRFLRDELAEGVARFLSREAVFQTVHGLYSASGHRVDEDTWHQADESDRFYKYDVIDGVREELQLSRNLLCYLKVRAALTDPRFRHLLEEMTGRSLGQVSPPHANRYRQGDFLAPHSDDDWERSLSLVLYLAPNWRPDLGGALHMQDEGGAEHVIGAELNSLVVFDVTANSRHHIAPLTAAARDFARLSIGCWCSKPEPAREKAPPEQVGRGL